MYVDRKPSLYLEDLRHDFKNSLSKFEMVMKHLIRY
ncbi:GTP pyrophosphokinase ywaC [Staphylococcus aureus]|uniref:GTP pyrophosphokinase ywaC n=1 Tax=Staphylococcus aureus TaxID=1280 RepID=A0A380DQ29_STAAU|nr:GTP pyrophosphokinase ywaC [Staphylococcus aureus]